MKPTDVPRPVKLGEPYESVESPYPPVMQMSHAFSQFSVCSCDLALYSMNLYVYPTDFVRSPFRCSLGPCRCRMGFGTPYSQSCRIVWGKYRACRTHKYGRLSDLTRTTIYGPKIVGSPSLKPVHAHHSAMGYTALYRPKNPPKIVQTPSAVIHSA